MSICLGFGIATTPIAPALQDRLGALRPTAMARRAARRCPAARPEVDDQLAAGVEVLEVVVAGLGDRQAVAGEDERGLDVRRGSTRSEIIASSPRVSAASPTAARAPRARRSGPRRSSAT